MGGRLATVPAFSDVTWSERVAEAIWIRERLAPFHAFIVSSVVPGGFDAYARILHPVLARSSAPRRVLRWLDVAAWTGTTLRRDAQFHSVALPPAGPASEPPWDGPPEEGNMDPADAEALTEILRSETSTPESCWFCLWQGFGWVEEVVPAAVWNGPRVHLPNRDYLLYGGPVQSVVLTSEGGRQPAAQSASLWWSADRAWCVATEIDLSWTYVSGTARLIESVLHDPRLEAVAAAAEDPLTRVEPWVRRSAEDAASELMRTGSTTIVTSVGSVEAWLERPGVGGQTELWTRSPGRRGATRLHHRDDADLREKIVSSLTWKVTELVDLWAVHQPPSQSGTSAP